MNEMQTLWLQQYKNYLKACSPTGELSAFDYTAALGHADAVLNSLLMLKEPEKEMEIITLGVGPCA